MDYVDWINDQMTASEFMMLVDAFAKRRFGQVEVVNINLCPIFNGVRSLQVVYHLGFGTGNHLFGYFVTLILKYYKMYSTAMVCN